MHKSFRFEPPTTDDDRLIARPRIAVALAQRFEHRLTTLVAAAGFGKTTALAQAVRSNALDPIGRDIWLRAFDSDADPLNMLSGLLESCGLEGSGRIDTDIAAVSDHVWGLSPHRVSLIIDDAHHLTNACSTTLELLLASLPANGHLLLSGRSIPTLAVADLRVRRDVLELSHLDLSLDDSEAEALIAARGGGDPATLPRHAASADLGLVAGPEAISDYLWQEVLSGLDPARLRALGALSLLPELDDALSLAHSHGRYDAEGLTVGLPLVETHSDDSKRMHELLCQPLRETLDDEQKAVALTVSGGVALGRGHYEQAVGLYAAAGRHDLAEPAAREFATLVTIRTRLDSVRSIRKSVAGIADGSALHQLLDAQSRLNLNSAERIERFVSAADHAHKEGDGHIEAVAVFWAIQAANGHQDPLPPELVARIEALAPAVSYAAGVLAYTRSLEIQAGGDGRGAMEALRGLDVLADQALAILQAERFCELGRPEDVFAELSTDHLAELPQGAALWIAFARWLRGDVSPEAALAIGSAMVPRILSQGLVQPSISILSVVAHIALAAGEMETARRYASELTILCAQHADARPQLFSAMVSASVLSTEGDDHGAAAVLDPETTGMAFGLWPARALMVGLPLLYLVRPKTRAMLDACSFGPALTTAVAAGRALAALREEGSTDGAVSLPWTDEWILRAHVLPPHLGELAAAAASEGSPAAEALLSKLPSVRLGIERLQASGHRRAAGWAGRFLGGLPPEAPYLLTINALGPLEVVRDGQSVRDGDWVKRVRVRELLGVVVEQRTIGRGEAAELLWPDLSAAKASSNLRVTLSHLQGVLQPDRPPDVAPSFVQGGSAGFVLSDDVDVDVDDFDALLQRAHATDNAGAPAEAMVLYRAALSLYRGPYMADLDAPWAAITRLRLDSAARTAMARLGALELARGEPEEALHWATKALKANDIDERAGRLLMSAIGATGDRAGAVEAGTRLVAALKAAGLGPEPATQRSLDRHGVGW